MIIDILIDFLRLKKIIDGDDHILCISDADLIYSIQLMIDLPDSERDQFMESDAGQILERLLFDRWLR